MKKIVLVLTCLVFLLSVGCKSLDEPIKMDDEIQGKISKDIDELFEDIKVTIQSENREEFLALCFPGTEELNSLYFTEFLSNGLLYVNFFSEKNYQQLSRYYINDIGAEGLSASYVSEGYDFVVPATEEKGERYVYIAEGEYNGFDIVFTAVFKKDDSKWKVDKFLLGDIRPYGKTIISLIEKAKTLEEDGNLISSYMYNDLAGGFVSPSPYINYSNESVISDSMLRIAEELNEVLTFPIDIKVNEDTYVKLYAVTSNKYPDGFYCRVSYVTNVPENQASDDIIRREATRIHGIVKEQLTGLGEGFDGNIVYTAYFEEPVTQGREYNSITVSLEEDSL